VTTIMTNSSFPRIFGSPRYPLSYLNTIKSLTLIIPDRLFNMDPVNTVLDPATTAQEERSLMTFQNLALGSRPICPVQSSDSEMVVSEVNQPTPVQVSWVASPPIGLRQSGKWC
jgi:hypothetical protein